MEQKETQVTAQMDNLSSEISKLENSVDTLRDRLSQVVRDDGIKESDDEDKEPVALLVPLASGIRSYHQQVRYVHVKIVNILSLLEL